MKEIIEEKLNAFFYAIGSVQHHQTLIERVTKETISELLVQQKIASNFPEQDRKIMSSSLNVSTFRNPYTGQILPLHVRETSIEEKMKLIHLHKNSQYQWLLVQAFELFEDYAVSLYELNPSIKPEIGLKKDGGNLTSRELKTKVMKIVSAFRLQNGFKDIEVSNKLDINLRLHLAMIEKFRHIIVHKNGRTHDIEKVVTDILKDSCLLSDKTNGPTAKMTLSQFFGENEYQGLILLVEKPIFNTPGFSMHANVLEFLLNVLSSYAFIMSRTLFAYTTAPSK